VQNERDPQVWREKYAAERAKRAANTPAIWDGAAITEWALKQPGSVCPGILSRRHLPGEVCERCKDSVMKPED
jgi:hypothetical protein